MGPETDFEGSRHAALSACVAPRARVWVTVM